MLKCTGHHTEFLFFHGLTCVPGGFTVQEGLGKLLQQVGCHKSGTAENIWTTFLLEENRYITKKLHHVVVRNAAERLPK